VRPAWSPSGVRRLLRAPPGRLWPRTGLQHKGNGFTISRAPACGADHADGREGRCERFYAYLTATSSLTSALVPRSLSAA